MGGAPPGVVGQFVPHVVDSLVGALLTEDPTVVTETRAWLGDVLTRRGGDRVSLDALQQALAARLRECRQALRMLRG